MLGAKQATVAAQQPQEEAQEAQEAPEMESNEPGEGTNVTPEEQAMYDKVVKNAQALIYPPEGGANQVILEGLQGRWPDQIKQMFADAEPPLQDNPVDALAATACFIVLMLDSSAEQAGQHIPDDVLYHAGTEIMEDLGDVAQAANIHDYSPDDLEGAWYRAVDLFRTASPRADPETLGQEFAQIANADHAGKLGELLPGIQERMSQGG